jgi:hypothetical protein
MRCQNYLYKYNYQAISAIVFLLYQSKILLQIFITEFFLNDQISLDDKASDVYLIATRMNLKKIIVTVTLLLTGYILVNAQNKIIVFQSDFGLKDGAVSAMKGVASVVSQDLKLYDLTHEIPVYNIWEAALRLEQTVPYWPA